MQVMSSEDVKLSQSQQRQVIFSLVKWISSDFINLIFGRRCPSKSGRILWFSKISKNSLLHPPNPLCLSVEISQRFFVSKITPVRVSAGVGGGGGKVRNSNFESYSPLLSSF